MFKSISLSADERTMLVFCLDDYRHSIKDSESEIVKLIETLHLPSDQVGSLIDELFSRKPLSPTFCARVTNALWAWQAVTDRTALPIEPLYAKLLAGAAVQ